MQNYDSAQRSDEELTAALNVTLSDLDDAIGAMRRAGRDRDALEVKVEQLRLMERYHGPNAGRTMDCRLELVGTLLDSTEVLLVDNAIEDALGLLTIADNLMGRPSSAAPVAATTKRGVLRLWLSMRHAQLLVRARHLQRRFRSAVTAAAAVVDIAQTRLHAVWELPSAELNRAAVLSAAGKHSLALTQTYAAYQAVTVLLYALTTRLPDEQEDYPDRRDVIEVLYFHEAAALEDSVNAGDWAAAAQRIGRCDYLLRQIGSPMGETALAAKAGEVNVTDLFLEHNDERGDEFVPLPAPARQRWAGVLALVYRAIACEQEHLEQTGAALLTYRVGVSTAESTLGADHPVTEQCRDALNAAQRGQHNAARRPKTADLRRLPVGRVPGASGVPVVSYVKTSKRQDATATSGAASRRSGSASRSFRRVPSAASGGSRATPTQDRSVGQSPALGSDVGVGSDAQPQAAGRRVLHRPQWNGWFASDAPPPTHGIVGLLSRPAKFKPKPRVESAPRSSAPREPTVTQHSTTVGDSASNRSAAGSDGYQRDDDLIRSIGEDELVYSVAGPSGGSPADHHRADDAAPPLNDEDLEFLHTTFRVRREPGTRSATLAKRRERLAASSANQRQTRASGRGSLPADAEQYYVLLDDHRRHCDDLKAELGMV